MPLRPRRIIHRNRARDFVSQSRAWHHFRPADGRPCGAQFAPQRVAVAKFAVIRLRVRVSSRSHLLEIGPGQGRLVRGQRVLGAAGAEQKDGDESREESEGEVTALSIGQGEPPLAGY